MKFFSYFADPELEHFFYQKPHYFDKYSNRDLLSYALGATLYMPAVRPNFHHDILRQKQNGLTSLVIDLEDAVADLELNKAEFSLIEELWKLYETGLNNDLFEMDELPLLFIRIRNLAQFKRVYGQLGEASRLLTGVVFPKFEVESGRDLLKEVRKISTEQQPFYAMPILETNHVINKETRLNELWKIKQLLDEYKANILNVRIGATDFSGIYGIRRSYETTVYDLAVLRDCIADIINLFQRADSAYTISGPVWEYFTPKDHALKSPHRQPSFRKSFGDVGYNGRTECVNPYMDGLIREVHMDIANGLIGKTVIHPSQIRVVQALNVVSYEDYIDALNVTESVNGDNGARKSFFSNKMNEMKPHFYWAQKVLIKSQLYGVLNEEYTNTDLIKKEILV